MSGSNSELINALQGGGLLSSLSHPQGINLLGAYHDAASTADAIWRTRKWQAEQAAGQNFLNSINPDGTPNQQALLQGARNTPGMALVAQPSAQAGQTLSAGTQKQNLELRDTVNQMLPSVLKLPDGELHDGVVQSFLQLEKLGLMTHQRSLQIQGGLSNDPTQLRTQLTHIQTSNQGPVQQQQTTAGVPFKQTGPDGRTIGGVIDPNTGAVSGPEGQPGLGQGPSPDTVFTAPPAIVPDTRPGAPPGSVTPIPRSYPGAGAGGPPPIPGTGGYTPPKMAGYRPRGGAPPGGGDDGAAQSQQTYLAAPQGQQDMLTNDQKISFAASAATNDQQKRAIAGETALQALRLARTGPGTATEAQYQAFLEAHGFSVPDKAGLSATDYRQLLKKNLLRFAQTAGKEAGTDFQLTEKLASNANVDEMTNPANEHVLIQDMGILRRDMAMTRAMPQPSGTGDVAKHIKTFPGDTDPRAFAVDLMSQPERAALLAEAAKQGPAGKIYKSLKMAHDQGHISLPSP